MLDIFSDVIRGSKHNLWRDAREKADFSTSIVEAILQNKEHHELSMPKKGTWLLETVRLHQNWTNTVQVVKIFCVPRVVRPRMKKDPKDPNDETPRARISPRRFSREAMILVDSCRHRS